ncbi:MAG: hypothetical protein IT319_12990 [Anaerolineae bacterium]|nr:hypothetical protein [Anaerolineae bacterium]
MKHKFLIVAPMLLVLLLLSVSAVGAQGSVGSCGIYADKTSLAEGETVQFDIGCLFGGIVDLYAFQFGTTATGPIHTVGGATQYMTGQNWFDTGYHGGIEPFTADNKLTNFASSSMADIGVTTPDETILFGSIEYTPNHVEGDTTATLSFLSYNSLKLGDHWGASITPSSLTSSVTVNIIDMWSLRLTVKSDGHEMSKLSTVQATVDSLPPMSQATAWAPPGGEPSVAFNFEDKLVAGSTPSLLVSMRSHLSCFSPALTLGGSVTTGTITLFAGEVAAPVLEATPTIDMVDIVRLGDMIAGIVVFNPNKPTEDVNGSGSVNIFDLIHASRNYGTQQGACVVG